MIARSRQGGSATSTKRLLHVAGLTARPTHRQPSATRLLLASVLALGGSLLADAILVAIGTTIFPSTKGYGHFQFSDYGRLTVIGVVVACIGWPIVTRLSTRPRRLYFVAAVLVTLVLFLPDVFILVQGQPPRAVAVLLTMHLAIALVTYNAMVRLAPVAPPPSGGWAPPRVGSARLASRPPSSRAAGTALPRTPPPPRRRSPG